MADSYLPSRESEFDVWARNLATKVAATPTAFGLNAAQATALTALNTAWHAAYLVTTDNDTRTPAAIAAKNTAKAELIDGPGGIRELVKIIQAYPPLTNEQRVSLGITVPDLEPTPVPPPADPPVLAILSTLGRTTKLALRDITDSEKRGKPVGVSGATVLMFVGEEAPIDPLAWTFLTNTTKTVIDIEFQPAIPAGAKVWLTAFWKNRREEAGPAAVPVSTFIGDTLAQAA